MSDKRPYEDKADLPVNVLDTELTWAAIEAAVPELPPPADRPEKQFVALIADLQELVAGPIDKGAAERALAGYDSTWAQYSIYIQAIAFIAQNRRTRVFMPRMPEIERQARLLRAQDAQELASYLRAELFHQAEVQGVVLGRGQL